MPELVVGVRELKTQLSKYLRQVRAGRTVIITDRGKTVGRIVPPDRTLHERIAAMTKAGLADWNGQHLPAVKQIVRNRGVKTVADLLIEDRR